MAQASSVSAATLGRNMKSQSAHCPACFNEPECGFFGKLLFGDNPVLPDCEHHDPPVRMILVPLAAVTSEMRERWSREMHERES